MAKIRNTHRFGTTPNTLLNNPEISLKAKGLYGYMDSKPETWDFTIKGMVSQLKESFDAVRGAINELETAGYLARQQFKDEKGQWDCDYELYPDPTLNPKKGKPYRENPHTVNSVSGKPPHISNKEISKKEKEKKEGVEEEKKKENSIPEIVDWNIPEEILDDVLQGLARWFCFTGLYNQPTYFFDKFELRTEFEQAKAYYKQKDKESRIKSDPTTKLIGWFKANKSISEPKLDHSQIYQMSEQEEDDHNLAELAKFKQNAPIYA
jgi:hypothetical protein